MQNEVLKALRERRSVKSYLPDPVPQDAIDAIIEAGLYAPNGRGLQSSIIIAVTDKETRDRLSDLNKRFFPKDIDPFYGAPVVLIVLADKSAPTCVYDGSLTMGNMMLAAHSLGLGSCWIHRAKQMFESEEGKKLLSDLDVEGDYEGIGNCIIGYAASEPEAKERKANRVFYIK